MTRILILLGISGGLLAACGTAGGGGVQTAEPTAESQAEQVAEPTEGIDTEPDTE